MLVPYNKYHRIFIINLILETVKLHNNNAQTTTYYYNNFRFTFFVYVYIEYLIQIVTKHRRIAVMPVKPAG